jgi:hypothetical protein
MKKSIFVIFVLVAATLLTACGGQPTAAPAVTPTPNALATQVAKLEVQQATQVALLGKLAATPTTGPTATLAAAPTTGPAVTETLSPTQLGAAAPAAVVETHELGNPGACPTDGSATIVWPGYDSPHDKNRYEVGYGSYEAVCFPNGGSVLASYIRIGGKTYADVLDCDRDQNPTAICGYLLGVPPGVVVQYHTGVGGTLYPDPGGELYGEDGNIHPWLRDITSEVFPPQK